MGTVSPEIPTSVFVISLHVCVCVCMCVCVCVCVCVEWGVSRPGDGGGNSPKLPIPDTSVFNKTILLSFNSCVDDRACLVKTKNLC